MNSYWEHSIAKNKIYDWLIIGGGILGHFCAFEIKEKYPLSSVAILEKDNFGFGATTRNAGFACFGTVGEFLSDSRLTNSDKALSTLIKRKIGLDILTTRLSKDSIGFEACGGYEILGDNELNILLEIEPLNKLIHNSIGLTNTFEKRENKFFTNRIGSTIFNKYEGVIKSDMLMHSLKQEALRLGIQTVSGYEAIGLMSTPTGAEVQAVSLNKKSLTANKNSVEPLTFKAGHILVATNALLKDLLPESNVMPQRGQVFVSAPLDLKLDSSYHYDSGYYYFRSIQESGEKPRLLLGGARNVSFETENTSSIEINEKIMSHLCAWAGEVLAIPGQIKIDYSWAGLMGFSPSKEPIISLNLRPNISSVFACNGMGVAMSPYIAKEFVKGL